MNDTLHTADKSAYRVPPCRENLRVCYADNDLLVIDKPSGLLSVPGRHPANKDCVISRLNQGYPTARIVHRLDLATSGLMVVALHADSHRDLSRQFALRRVGKAYIADVWGLAPERGVIDQPLSCDWPNRPRQQVDTNGKPARTRFRRLSTDTLNNRSRVLLRPVTGRSHQLRVHLAHIGHPILGCEFYAHEQALTMASRLLLHASRLAFHHPATGTHIIVHSAPPFVHL